MWAWPGWLPKSYALFLAGLKTKIVDLNSSVEVKK
jgi:hypothetical protein